MRRICENNSTNFIFQTQTSKIVLLSFYFQKSVCTLLFIILIHSLLPTSRAQSENIPLIKICERDVTIPDVPAKCGICENRCGTKLNPDHFQCPHREIKHLCSCDKFCTFHGDCCKDFNTSCPEEFKEFQDISEQYPLKHESTDFICKGFDTVEGLIFHNLVINTCADKSSCELTTKVQEDTYALLPVYDIHREVHYISGQCALCNGATDVKPWNVIVECQDNQSDNEEHFPNDKRTKITNFMTGLFLRCDKMVLLYEPSGESRPCSKDMKSTCRSSCKNQKLRNCCEKGPMSLTNLKFHLKHIRMNTVQCVMEMICGTMLEV